MLRILLVDDNPQDRQALHYLFDTQFKGQVELSEMASLAQAVEEALTRDDTKSRLDLLEHRVGKLEEDLKGLEHEADKADSVALQIAEAKWSFQAKVIVAILALVGVISNSVATYLATTHKSPPKPVPGAVE